MERKEVSETPAPDNSEPSRSQWVQQLLSAGIVLDSSSPVKAATPLSQLQRFVVDGRYLEPELKCSEISSSEITTSEALSVEKVLQSAVNTPVDLIKKRGGTKMKKYQPFQQKYSSDESSDMERPRSVTVASFSGAATSVTNVNSFCSGTNTPDMITGPSFSNIVAKHSNLPNASDISRLTYSNLCNNQNKSTYLSDIKLPPNITVVPKGNGKPFATKRAPPPIVPIDKIPKLTMQDQITSRLRRLGTDIELEKKPSYNLLENLDVSISLVPLPNNSHTLPKLKLISTPVSSSTPRLQPPPDLIPINSVLGKLPGRAPGGDGIDSTVPEVSIIPADTNEQTVESDEDDFILDKLEVTFSDDDDKSENDFNTSIIENTTPRVVGTIKQVDVTAQTRVEHSSDYFKTIKQFGTITQSVTASLNGTSTNSTITPSSGLKFNAQLSERYNSVQTPIKYTNSSDILSKWVIDNTKMCRTTANEGSSVQGTVLKNDKTDQKLEKRMNNTSQASNIAHVSANRIDGIGVKGQIKGRSTKIVSLDDVRKHFVRPPEKPSKVQSTNKTEKKREEDRFYERLLKKYTSVIYFSFGRTFTEEVTKISPRGQKCYVCDICDGDYLKLVDLKKHYVRTHVCYKYICCDDAAKYSIELSEIVHSTYANDGYASPLISVSDSKIKSRMDVYCPGLFRCNKCGQRFNEKDLLRYHLFNHPIIEMPLNRVLVEKSYDCSYCHTVFLTEEPYLKHKRECVLKPIAAPRGSSVNVRKPSSPISNNHSPSSPIGNDSGGETESRASDASKTSLCLYCDHVHDGKTRKGTHGLTKHHPKRKLHSCYFCGVEKSLPELFEHLCKDHIDKYHGCLKCKKRFETRDALNAHSTELHVSGTKNTTRKRRGVRKQLKSIVRQGRRGILSAVSRALGKRCGRKAKVPRKFICKTCKMEFSNNIIMGKHRKEAHRPAVYYSLYDQHKTLLRKLPKKREKEMQEKEQKELPYYPPLSFYTALDQQVKINLLFFMSGSLNSQQPAVYEEAQNQQLKALRDLSLPEEPTDSSKPAENRGPVTRSTTYAIDLKNHPAIEAQLYFGWGRDYTCLYGVKKTLGFEEVFKLKPTKNAEYFRSVSIANITTQLNHSRTLPKTRHQQCGIRKKDIVQIKENTEDGLKMFMSLLGLTRGGRTVPDDIEFSGEASLPTTYVCSTCSKTFTAEKEAKYHLDAVHPLVQNECYKFVGEEAPGHPWALGNSLKVGGKFRISGSEEKSTNLTSTPNVCTKCNIVVKEFTDFHKHVLECSGDTDWAQPMLRNSPKKSRRYRPFGSRRRSASSAKRGSSTPTKNENDVNGDVSLPPKVYKRGGDEDSVKKMLANLPPKRRTRRTVVFDETQIIRPKRQYRKRQKEENSEVKNEERPSNQAVADAVTQEASVGGEKNFSVPEQDVSINTRPEDRVVLPSCNTTLNEPENDKDHSEKSNKDQEELFKKAFFHVRETTVDNTSVFSVSSQDSVVSHVPTWNLEKGNFLAQQSAPSNVSNQGLGVIYTSESQVLLMPANSASFEQSVDQGTSIAREMSNYSSDAPATTVGVPTSINCTHSSEISCTRMGLNNAVTSVPQMQVILTVNADWNLNTHSLESRNILPENLRDVASVDDTTAKIFCSNTDPTALRPDALSRISDGKISVRKFHTDATNNISSIIIPSSSIATSSITTNSITSGTTVMSSGVVSDTLSPFKADPKNTFTDTVVPKTPVTVAQTSKNIQDFCQIARAGVSNAKNMSESNLDQNCLKNSSFILSNKNCFDSVPQGVLMPAVSSVANVRLCNTDVNKIENVPKGPSLEVTPMLCIPENSLYTGQQLANQAGTNQSLLPENTVQSLLTSSANCVLPPNTSLQNVSLCNTSDVSQSVVIIQPNTVAVGTSSGSPIPTSQTSNDIAKTMDSPGTKTAVTGTRCSARLRKFRESMCHSSDEIEKNLLRDTVDKDWKKHDPVIATGTKFLESEQSHSSSPLPTVDSEIKIEQGTVFNVNCGVIPDIKNMEIKYCTNCSKKLRKNNTTLLCIKCVKEKQKVVKNQLSKASKDKKKPLFPVSAKTKSESVDSGVCSVNENNASMELKEKPKVNQFVNSFVNSGVSGVLSKCKLCKQQFWGYTKLEQFCTDCFMSITDSGNVSVPDPGYSDSRIVTNSLDAIVHSSGSNDDNALNISSHIMCSSSSQIFSDSHVVSMQNATSVGNAHQNCGTTNSVNVALHQDKSCCGIPEACIQDNKATISGTVCSSENVTSCASVHDSVTTTVDLYCHENMNLNQASLTDLHSTPVKCPTDLHSSAVSGGQNVQFQLDVRADDTNPNRPDLSNVVKILCFCINCQKIFENNHLLREICDDCYKKELQSKNTSNHVTYKEVKIFKILAICPTCGKLYENASLEKPVCEECLYSVLSSENKMDGRNQTKEIIPMKDVITSTGTLQLTRVTSEDITVTENGLIRRCGLCRVRFCDDTGASLCNKCIANLNRYTSRQDEASHMQGCDRNVIATDIITGSLLHNQQQDSNEKPVLLSENKLPPYFSVNIEGETKSTSCCTFLTCSVCQGNFGTVSAYKDHCKLCRGSHNISPFHVVTVNSEGTTSDDGRNRPTCFMTTPDPNSVSCQCDVPSRVTWSTLSVNNTPPHVNNSTLPISNHEVQDYNTGNDRDVKSDIKTSNHITEKSDGSFTISELKFCPGSSETTLFSVIQSTGCDLHQQIKLEPESTVEYCQVAGGNDSQNDVIVKKEEEEYSSDSGAIAQNVSCSTDGKLRSKRGRKRKTDTNEYATKKYKLQQVGSCEQGSNSNHTNAGLSDLNLQSETHDSNTLNLNEQELQLLLRESVARNLSPRRQSKRISLKGVKGFESNEPRVLENQNANGQEEQDSSVGVGNIEDADEVKTSLKGKKLKKFSLSNELKLINDEYNCLKGETQNKDQVEVKKHQKRKRASAGNGGSDNKAVPNEEVMTRSKTKALEISVSAETSEIENSSSNFSRRYKKEYVTNPEINEKTDVLPPQKLSVGQQNQEDDSSKLTTVEDDQYVLKLRILIRKFSEFLSIDPSNKTLFEKQTINLSPTVLRNFENHLSTAERSFLKSIVTQYENEVERKKDAGAISGSVDESGILDDQKFEKSNSSENVGVNHESNNERNNAETYKSEGARRFSLRSKTRGISQQTTPKQKFCQQQTDETLTDDSEGRFKDNMAMKLDNVLSKSLFPILNSTMRPKKIYNNIALKLLTCLKKGEGSIRSDNSSQQNGNTACASTSDAELMHNTLNDPNDKQYPCPMCEQRFQTTRERNKHITRDHPVKNESVSSEAELSKQKTEGIEKTVDQTLVKEEQPAELPKADVEPPRKINFKRTLAARTNLSYEEVRVKAEKALLELNTDPKKRRL